MWYIPILSWRTILPAIALLAAWSAQGSWTITIPPVFVCKFSHYPSPHVAFTWCSAKPKTSFIYFLTWFLPLIVLLVVKCRSRSSVSRWNPVVISWLLFLLVNNLHKKQVIWAISISFISFPLLLVNVCSPNIAIGPNYTNLTWSPICIYSGSTSSMSDNKCWIKRPIFKRESTLFS